MLGEGKAQIRRRVPKIPCWSKILSAEIHLLLTYTYPYVPTSALLASLTETAPSSLSTNALQILTSHVLLTLLSSPPSHSAPLARIREIIAAVDLPGASNEKARAVFGCVARGLLKVDRSKREAIVAFAE